MDPRQVALALVFAAVFVSVVGFVQANHFSVCAPGCNTTVVWWNDSVNLTGVGSAVSSVTARINGVTSCTTTTSASGSWSCSFSAPVYVGRYNLSVTVGSVSDDSVLTVKPAYGQVPAGSTPRYVLELPTLVQEPSGRMRLLVNRLMVSRGAPN